MKIDVHYNENVWWTGICFKLFIVHFHVLMFFHSLDFHIAQFTGGSDIKTICSLFWFSTQSSYWNRWPLQSSFASLELMRIFSLSIQNAKNFNCSYSFYNGHFNWILAVTAVFASHLSSFYELLFLLLCVYIFFFLAS